MPPPTAVRRRLLVDRAIAAVGTDWEYFGRIADTRGFADAATGAMDELEDAGVKGPLGSAAGRLADVSRLFAAFHKLKPPSVTPAPDVARPAPRTHPPAAELFEAPGPVGEARMVARRIRELMAEGVSPSEIVVTARDIETPADVFAEVFDEYAIPHFGFPPPSLSRAPVVAFILRAWRVPPGGYAFADVAAILRSTYYRPSEIAPEMAIRAEALLRKIGSPNGKEAFLRSVDRWAETPPQPQEDEVAETSTWRRIHHSAGECRPFLRTFFAHLDDMPGKAQPAKWVERIRRFARDCGVEPATRPDDAAALETFWSALADWVELLPSKAVRAAEFHAALATVASTVVTPVNPPAGPAVRVLPAEEARTAAGDHFFLTGLGEGSFPRLAPPVSLLTDSDRIELRQAGHRLVDPAGRRDSEQTLFDDLVNRPNRSLVLSYPAVDAKGREQLPSSFLTDWREKNPRVTVTKRTMLIQNYATDVPYSDAERRVRFANGQADSAVSADVAVTLDRARQLAQARFIEKSFHRFDGCLSPEFMAANRDLFGHGLDATHVFSPTALEKYVACPFRYWLDHVLGVEPLDDPPDAVELTRRGSAVHRALARFHGDGPDPDDDVAVTTGVRGHFDRAVAEFQAKAGGDVTTALWELERLRLHRSADRYAEQWRTFRTKEAKAGPTPVPRLFEAAFGLKATNDRPSRPPLLLTVDGIEVRIGGTVDRIDVAELPDAIGFWIIDYKSGRGSYYTGTSVVNLEALQLPLYALAAERVLFPGQTARPLGLAYWLVTDTGSKGVFPKIDWPTFRVQLERRIVSLATGIRAGRFPLAPRSTNCTSTCPHGPVCRITQHRQSTKVI